MRLPRMLLLTALAAGLPAACADRPTARAGELRGITLPQPIARPDFTLTATDGQPFSFRDRTAGKLTLLFFGYTNCPDICPVHAASIAAVVKTLSWDDRQRVAFVFVTTDPARDSLPALRAWLDHFDPSFIGLRGSLDDVNAIQYGLNLPAAMLGEPRADGTYDVGHSAVVIAFEPDDVARVVYPFGVRQEDWAADLPKLLSRNAP